MGEHINFTNLPFDLGILHYASDTPYSKGVNLGRGSLDYQGLDSTYATCVAIARRIMELELVEVARAQGTATVSLPPTRRAPRLAAGGRQRQRPVAGGQRV